VSCAIFGSLPWRPRSQHVLAAKSCLAHNLFEVGLYNYFTDRTTCRAQHLGRYLVNACSLSTVLLQQYENYWLRPTYNIFMLHLLTTWWTNNFSVSNLTDERESPRKHRLHEKTAVSVLLKLFISSNEWCHTTDAP